MNIAIEVTKKENNGIANELEAKISQKNSANPLKVKELENKYINMNEKFLVVNFLKNLSEKNYAEAHKYLHKIMESKLAARITKNKSVNLF